jgi:hypothetical protein
MNGNLDSSSDDLVNTDYILDIFHLNHAASDCKEMSSDIFQSH